MTSISVSWPCLLKLEGDDELIYLQSYTNLHSECESLIWGQGDYVIDSRGHTFGLQYDDVKQVTLSSNNTLLSVEEVTTLIQSHEFSQAQRCTIKIQFTTVEQAVAALAS